MARTMVDVWVWHDDLSITQKLVTEVCSACAVVFAMPKELYDRAQDDPAVYFYCPNGHSQHYTRDQLAIARRERDAARKRADLAEATAKRQRERANAAERSASAYKGVATRMRKRIGRGVCPACNRHFNDVDRHMGTQHPGYAAAPVTPGG
jgi:hypothetical protein